MSTREVKSPRLRRPDKSVLIARGVEKETNDDIEKIYPGGLSELDSGGGVAERRVNAIAQQKGFPAGECVLVVYPYNVVLEVTASSKGTSRSAWEIDRGVLPSEQ